MPKQFLNLETILVNNLFIKRACQNSFLALKRFWYRKSLLITPWGNGKKDTFQVNKENDFKLHLRAFMHLFAFKGQKKINPKFRFKIIFPATFFPFKNSLPHEIISKDLRLIYFMINYKLLSA